MEQTSSGIAYQKKWLKPYKKIYIKAIRSFLYEKPDKFKRKGDILPFSCMIPKVKSE